MNTPTPEAPALPTYEELTEQLATCQARWQHEVALRREREAELVSIGSITVNGVDYVPKQLLTDTAAKQLALEAESTRLRKRLTEIECPHCKMTYDHLYPEKP